MKTIITIAHTVLTNVAPIIMNMVMPSWLEVGDVGPAGLGVGEDFEDGAELEVEGVGEDFEDGAELEVEGVGEDIGSGTEDDGEPETDF